MGMEMACIIDDAGGEGCQRAGEGEMNLWNRYPTHSFLGSAVAAHGFWVVLGSRSELGSQLERKISLERVPLRMHQVSHYNVC
jgi:hypothetical protein